MERNPRRIAGIATAAGLAAVALTIFVRRVSGVPLRDVAAGEAAVYTVAFLAVALAATRFAFDEISDRRGRDVAAGFASFFLVLMLAAGLSNEPLTVLTCLLASGIVLGIAAFASVRPTSAARAEEKGVPTVLSAVEEPASIVENAGPSVLLARSIVDGCERLEGLIRFEIDPGETSKTLHVPLWPALSAAPTVACELEGLQGRVRVPYSKPHGFRIEVRLPEPTDEPLLGAVRFTADSPKRAAAG